jgi:hypothetical protein
MENLPIILRRDVLPHAGGLQVETRHERQADGAIDEHRAYDLFVAKGIFDDLERHYPGHRWKVEVSSKKGMIAISMPILMGSNWVYFIKWADLNPARVVIAGGEILERYKLARGRFDRDTFLEARDKHSIMLGRAKTVPT